MGFVTLFDVLEAIILKQIKIYLKFMINGIENIRVSS